MSDNAYYNPQTQLGFEKSYKAVLSYPAVSATGTHGLFAAASGGVATFTDTTAAAFTSSMVGKTITISGSSQGPSNNGTFMVTGYTSATVITVSNGNAVVDTAVGVWSIVGSPTIVAGDINQAYLSVVRAGTGLTVITSQDGFPQYVGLHPDLAPSTGAGSWHTEVGIAVQNITGVHPFFPAVSVPLNSFSIPFTTFGSSTAADLVPTVVSGTHGAPTITPTGGLSCTFVDSTANSFTPAMVGASIAVSGGAAANNGTFTVLSFVNAKTITISNATGVAATGLSWSVTIPTQISLELTFNNGPVQ